MVDNLDIPQDKIQDKAIIKSESGELPPPRDGARTPMQWDDSINAGFSFGKEVEPWLPVHENYTEKNVAKELKDPDSLFNFYRQLIKARKNSKALRFGRWNTLIHYPYEHLAYTRKTEEETVLTLINFSYEKDLEVDEYIAPHTWEVLVSNVREAGKIIDLPSKLYPFEVSVLRRDN